MRPKKVLLFAFIFFLAGFGGRPSLAEDFGVKRVVDSHFHLLPENEREHLRARDLREHSEEKSRAHLGYPDVFQDSPDRTIDYYLLSHQIARLRMLIEALESRRSENLRVDENFLPKVPPSLDLPGSFGISPGPQEPGNVASVYGEEGPNAQSVKLLLKYNLMLASNPRLKIGKIEEDDEKVTAEVVTVDGSLVVKYSIDRKTGLWKVIR